LPAFAGVNPIGMATSAGEIEVGRVRMPGPATLYEGALVETGSSPAQVSLRNGAIIRLSGGARATIHLSSLLLERGVGQVDAPGDYIIQARSMTFIPSSHPARARLQVTGDGALQVAALLGSFDVHRAGVASVGKVAAGSSLRFAPDSAEAGATAPSQFKGCLAKSEKGYLLQLVNNVDGSKTVVALAGSLIGAKSGDRVTVIGKPDTTATPVVGASEVVQVLRLTVDGHGCSAKSVIAAAAASGTAGAAGAGAAGAAGTAAAGTAAAGAGAAAAGMSAATVTVIGVAVAGAVLVPTIALTSDSSNISPSSR
jgi:hypothetical protein